MKNIIKSFFCIFFIFTGAILFSTEVKEMPQLIYPKNLLVKNDRILITDYPNIYLYSLKDFKLIKKFGRKGEGPGEFYIDQVWLDRKLAGLISDMSKTNIFVNSQGRFSVFSLNGEFIKMIKTHVFGGGYGFKSFNGDFIAKQIIRKGTKRFSAVKTYDKNLKEIREIMLRPSWIRSTTSFRKTGYDFFERANGVMSFEADSNLIYISRNNSHDIHIDVFKPDGKLLKTINYRTEKVKIPKSYIKEVHRYYIIKFKRGLKANIKATNFPENFPGLRKFFVEGRHIYIVTYKRDKNKNEIIILNKNGELIGKRMIPIMQTNPDHLYPCSIYQGYFYQIVEVGEDEDWEMHITKI